MITIDDRIKFEERYDDENYKTTTFYLMADTSLLKELIGDKYPEADGMTLSIECPADCIEAGSASVEISPYKKYEDTVTDYDWTDINLPYEIIEALINIATKGDENGRRIKSTD